MGYRQEIPMENAYRHQLRKEYERPLMKNTIMMAILFLGFSLLIFQNNLFNKEANYILPFFLIPMLLVCYKLYLRLKLHKLHYLMDADYGFIIKEQMTITKVFHTPAGINIYWLDSDDIKTFTPNPYRHFNVGEQVVIYYLKYSKEYLAYEIA